MAPKKAVAKKTVKPRVKKKPVVLDPVLEKALDRRYGRNKAARQPRYFKKAEEIMEESAAWKGDASDLDEIEEVEDGS